MHKKLGETPEEPRNKKARALGDNDVKSLSFAQSNKLTFA